MGRFDFGSFRVKLISLVLVTMIPVFGLIIYAGIHERDHIRERALTDTLNLARNICVSENNTLDGIRKTLFLLSQMLQLHDLSHENTEMVLKLVLANSPELAGFVVANSNGDIIADSYHSGKKFNISALPSFQRLMQTKKFVIGEYQESRITGKPLLTLRHPVFDKTGRVKKIISAGLDLGGFNRILREGKFSPQTHLNIVDHNGIVLFRHPSGGDFTGKLLPHRDIMEEAFTRKEGVREAMGRDGVQRIYGFASFGEPFGAVYITVGIPKDELFAPIDRTTFYQLLWLLAVTSLAIIIASLLGKVFIFRPLNKLLHAAKQIQNGDVTARVGDSSGRGEIAQLIHAFDHMGEALQQREESRAQAVRSLQESEVKLRTIFENSVDAIGVSRAGIQTFMNSAYLSLFGYSRTDELINQPVLMLIAPSEHETILARMKSHARGEVIPSQYETRGLRKDGTEFDMDVRVSVYELAGENYSLVILRDISERKQAEKALRQSEARLRASQESAHIGNWEWNPVTNELYWSEENYRIFGMAPQKISPSYEVFLNSIEPDERAFVEASVQDALSGRKPYDLDIHLIRPDGMKCFVHAKARVDYDEAGQAVMMVGTVQDITDRERMEEERKKLEDHLHRAEKMEALGKLAGGVAHDLNNVLGVLSGYSELLMERLPAGSPLRGYAANILKSSEKGAAIIQDLLTLARRGVIVSEVIDLNGIVSNLLRTPEFDMLRSSYPGVIFRPDLEKDLLSIKGSPVHLEKTVMNLLSNAAEAISGRGEVQIRTENRYLDKAVRGYDDVQEGDYVILTVADNGGGISATDLDKIFEPFYTKKTMGRSGTGLGLAIVWGTVKDHKGYIDVQSMEGRGTTFTLYFPVTREKKGEDAQKIPLEQYMGHGESVLVVDDVQEQRQVAATLLMRLGYRVASVSGGNEAVEYLKNNTVDILVLDMIMESGIDGLETYKRILAINPHQKAIIVSGFSETERVLQAQELGAGTYVKKPYLMEKVGIAVRNELDRSA